MTSSLLLRLHPSTPVLPLPTGGQSGKQLGNEERERERERWDSRLVAKIGTRQRKQEAATHVLEPVAFIHAPHQVQRQGPCPKEKPQSTYPRNAPLSQKNIKCWCVTILWGGPKGARALPPDQGSRRRDCSGKAGHRPSSQRTGREGSPPPPPWGLGKLDAVLGRN